MKRNNIVALLLVMLLLTGCAAPGTPQGPQRYEATFLDLFDTVTTVVGYTDSEADFQSAVETIHTELEIYHQLFDIYHKYPDRTNLKTVNDRGAQGPVEVDPRIMDLLLFCREMYEKTGGVVNVAMGSVLSLWHEARTEGINNPETARLPDMAALEGASMHIRFEDVILDEDHCTVAFADPDLKLDVGAVAKGYAVEQVCKAVPEGFLVSVGGNVCSTGSKPDGSSWVVGLQSPDGDGYLHTVYAAGHTAVITSGDYQRYYLVDGVRYHHIIDPATCMPGDQWQAVSVLCSDSAVGDVLSTALFLLDQEVGQTLLDQFGAEALWLDQDGTEYQSPGFAAYLRT